MFNVEKVIKGLECCTQHGGMCGHSCNGHWTFTDDTHTSLKLVDEYRTKCPYGNCETGCITTLAKDALALLKEQAEQIKRYELERSWDENPDTMGKW